MEFRYVLLLVYGIASIYTDFAAGKTAPPTIRPTTGPPTTGLPVIRYTQRPIWIKEDYPNPRTEEKQCHPRDRTPEKSNVCDPNELLTESNENYIKAMIRRLSIGSGCICKSGKCKLGQPGITLAVGIVQQIGYSTNRAEAVVQEFADYLRQNTWKFSGACEDEIVLVVSEKQKAAAVSVGKDVAKYLYQKNINPQPILKINPNAPIGSEAKRIVKHIGGSLNITVPEDDNTKTNIVSDDGIGVWNKVAAAGVIIGFIALLALTAALAAYCGRKCRGSESERTRRKVARSEGRTPGLYFIGRRRRETEAREVSQERNQNQKRERRAWFGRVGRNKKRGGEAEYHSYHDVPESIKEESEVRNPYYNNSNGYSRRSGDYANARSSGSYTSDRNSGYFESGGSQRGEPAHIF